MSTNISKKKREDLLSKINEIYTYILQADDDKNKDNLLTYLSELEKEVCSKKYGLVFEEHQEKIDEVLAVHTPVMSEEKDLFIDNGGPMNFLIEGDNLAALKLLTKTPVIDRRFYINNLTSSQPDISRYQHTVVRRYPCCWCPCPACSADICR